ncbi:TadE/TadG family type IV pilus assembly protein [Roseiarcus sp.]|uniref:TadE/TadG family type IV pilus assembly protein n=1 Tax=Roseiarcus sp. TaxID=1969460 RepID=UPI003F9563DF
MPCFPTRFFFAISRLGSEAGRAGRDSRGATAVEFAIVAPIVIATLLGALQIGVIYLAQAELENAAEEGARLVLTNQAQSISASAFQSAICGYLPALFTCANVMVDLESQSVSAGSSDALIMTPPGLTYNANGAVTNAWAYQPGTAGQLEILRVMYQWPVYAGPLGMAFGDLANGTLFLSSTQVFQNEQ